MITDHWTEAQPKNENIQIKEDKNEISKNSERKGKPINQKKKKKKKVEIETRSQGRVEREGKVDLTRLVGV